jgi:hypothetical protein
MPSGRIALGLSRSSTKVSIKKMPRAAFFLDPMLARQTREELAKKLQQHLACRFGPVRFPIPFIQRFLLNMARLIVNVQRRRVIVAVDRSRHPVGTPAHQRGWHLVIDPFVPIGRSFKMEKEYAERVALVFQRMGP